MVGPFRATDRCCGLLAIALLCGAGVAHAGSYEVIDLGSTRHGIDTLALAMNRHGVVVGQGGGPAKLQHPMKFMPNGHRVDLAVQDGMPDTWGQAVAINDHGTSLGWLTDADGFNGKIFTEQHGQMTLLTQTLEGFASALHINDAGDVVGHIGTKTQGCPGICAFTIHQAQWTLLPWPPKADMSFALAINRRGTIVGESVQITRHGSVNTAVRWHAGRIHPLPGLAGDWSTATSVNDQGEIAGHYSAAGVAWQHAFKWRHGTLTDLDGRTDSNSQAIAINNGGQVIGTRLTPERSGAYVTVDGAMQWLQDLLLTGPDGPWQLNDATALNDAGQIAARATDPQGQSHAVMLNPVVR